MLDNTENIEPKSNKGALRLFIVLFIISIGLSLFLFFKYAKGAAKVQQQHEELRLAYSLLDLKADSLQQDLDFALTNLQDKINENLALEDLKEGLRSQLNVKKEALIAAHHRISKLIAANSSSVASGEQPTNLLQAKKEIEKLEKTNTEFIAKVEEIQKEYVAAKQLAEINGRKANIVVHENDSLLLLHDTLSLKLENASILRIAGLTIRSIREKKGKQEITEKASKTERLKISFSVLESSLVAKESKEISVRIISPNGVVLANDTKTLTDSDDITTLTENISFTGEEKRVTFYYVYESDYPKGNYKVELYNDQILLDRGAFNLR